VVGERIADLLDLITRSQRHLETPVVLLTSTGKNNVPVEILCTQLEVKEGRLHPEGKGSGILSFSLCQTFIEGALSKVCKPAEPIIPKTLSLLVLHEGRDLDKFFPHEGKNFTNIRFSELCSLEVNGGAGVPITGTIFAKDCQNELLNEKVTHLIEEDAAATAALGGIFFGTHKMTLDGSANLSLTGAHAGLNWSGHPA
jgi:hypothetical protein